MRGLQGEGEGEGEGVGAGGQAYRRSFLSLCTRILAIYHSQS